MEPSPPIQKIPQTRLPIALRLVREARGRGGRAAGVKSAGTAGSAPNFAPHAGQNSKSSATGCVQQGQVMGRRTSGKRVVK